MVSTRTNFSAGKFPNTKMSFGLYGLVLRCTIGSGREGSAGYYPVGFCLGNREGRGLSKHLAFTHSSGTIPNPPKYLILGDTHMVIPVLTSGWLKILNYLFYYFVPVVLIQNSSLMFCKCFSYNQWFMLGILIACVLLSTRDLSPELAQS